jgi:hypothetical protein
MELLKRVIKKSVFIILPAIVLAFFYESRKLPLGIFFGWVFGLFNLRALTRNVEGLVGAEKGASRIVLLNIARLLTLSAAIFLLVYHRIVNIFGLLIGFTVVLALILIEGSKVK